MNLYNSAEITAKAAMQFGEVVAMQRHERLSYMTDSGEYEFTVWTLWIKRAAGGERPFMTIRANVYGEFYLGHYDLSAKAAHEDYRERCV